MTLDANVRQRIQEGYSAYLRGRDFRPRRGQKEMIAAIARALASGDLTRDEGEPGPVCVVEAGTGTGKTLAYLLAALPLAEVAEKQVVVATATVALQEQILHRDFPDLIAHTGWPYRVAVAKGRGRYMCPLRQEAIMDAVQAREAGLGLFEDEVPFQPSRSAQQLYRRLNNAFDAGEWPGDRDSWPDAISDQDWRPLTVERGQCAAARCRHFRDCPFFRDREALLDADCIIANHDLLLADLALGGGLILPALDETLYIIDEAHRFADTALRHFSGQCRVHATLSWLDNARKRLTVAQAILDPIDGFTATLRPLLDRFTVLEQGLAELEPLLRQLLDNVESDFGGTLRYRFPGGDVGEELRERALVLARQGEAVTRALESLGQYLVTALDGEHPGVPRPDIEQYHQLVGSWAVRAAGFTELWQLFAQPLSDAPGAAPVARWIDAVESQGGIDLQLNASPVNAGGLLNGHLWNRCWGAVLTSATLRSLGTFQRFERHLGAPAKATYTVVESAFDYAGAGELRVPRDAVEGGFADEHTESVLALLPELLEQERGTLALFSSQRQMESIYERLPEACKQRILMQGQYSNQEILQRHRQRIDEQGSSVIFGLASFAEGVDLPGDYCSHVIIAKLPFAVPNDPIQATMAEWIESRGGNPFMEMTLPDASLKLVQACGRLLRSEKDRGRITLLDRRVISKRYGSRILADLPPFRRVLS